MIDQRFLQISQPDYQHTLKTKFKTSEVLDILQSSWGRGFESHFEGEMKRKGSASISWLLGLLELVSIYG